MMDQRDPVAGAPRITKDALISDSSLSGRIVDSKVLDAAARTNRTVSTFRTMSKGEVSEEVASLSFSKQEWKRATEQARDVTRGVFQSHREKERPAECPTGGDAFSRITKGPASFVGPYAGGEPQAVSKLPKGAKPPPVRGDVVSAVVKEIALPPPGSIAVKIVNISTYIRRLFLFFRTLMLLPESEINWDRYHALEAYMDPLFKSKDEILALAARMYRAGMIIFVGTVKEFVSFFTVLKKDGPEGRKSRLVWDLRKGNLRWRRPPRAALASPLAFSYIELPDTGVESYVGFSGDLPDFYYTCGIDAEIAEYFGVPRITADELAAFIEKEFGEKVDTDPDRQGVALGVLGMGWNWACVLAQLILEEVTDGCPLLGRAFRISDVLRTPKFSEIGQVIHWGFIDDFAGILLGGKDLPATIRLAKELAEKVKSEFISRGWGVHKETLGSDLLSLGIDFCLIARRIRGSMLLWWMVCEATDHALRLPYVTAEAVEKIVGVWTWLALMNKCALSCFSLVYKWIRRWGGKGAQRLTSGVRAELSSMVAISVTFGQQLNALWAKLAYLVDASPSGGAVLISHATQEELWTEAEFAEKNGWWARLEDAGETAMAAFEQCMEEASKAMGEVLSRDERRQEAEWGARHIPLAEFTIVYISNSPRAKCDLAWLVKTAAAAEAWWVRLLWFTGELVPELSLEENRVWSEVKAIGSSGRIGGVLVDLQDQVQEQWAWRAVDLAAKISKFGAFALVRAATAAWRTEDGSRMLVDASGMDSWELSGDDGPHMYAVLPAGARVETPPVLSQSAAVEWAINELSVAPMSRDPEGTTHQQLRKERVPEVAECWDSLARWRICYKTQWVRREHNNISELRTVVAAFRNAVRTRSNWGCRVLVITDSLVALGAGARGRSSSYPLNRLLRQLAATVLATKIKTYLRWIGTKRNAADGPSRGFAVGHAPEWVEERERKLLKETIKKKMMKKRMLTLPTLIPEL